MIYKTIHSKLKIEQYDPHYEVSITRIMEQVDKKRSNIGTHRITDCLMKDTSPNITHILVSKNSSNLIVSVSENFLVE